LDEKSAVIAKVKGHFLQQFVQQRICMCQPFIQIFETVKMLLTNDIP